MSVRRMQIQTTMLEHAHIFVIHCRQFTIQLFVSHMHISLLSLYILIYTYNICIKWQYYLLLFMQNREQTSHIERPSPRLSATQLSSSEFCISTHITIIISSHVPNTPNNNKIMLYNMIIFICECGRVHVYASMWAIEYEILENCLNYAFDATSIHNSIQTDAWMQILYSCSCRFAQRNSESL